MSTPNDMSDPRKRFMISTRENSQYRWKSSKNIIGALEISSEPHLDIRDKYTQRSVQGKCKEFVKALDIWEDWGLRKQFIEACESVPVTTCCFGLIRDDDTFIQDLIPILNNSWVKTVNKKLMAEKKGFKIDLFIWTWNNATGKAQTNILLIRFFKRSAQMGSQEMTLQEMPSQEMISKEMAMSHWEVAQLAANKMAVPTIPETEEPACDPSFRSTTC